MTRGMGEIRRNGRMSYSGDLKEISRRVGVQYIGPILKGSKPADLPVQQAAKFEFVIDPKTARALGLDNPVGQRWIRNENVCYRELITRGFA